MSRVATRTKVAPKAQRPLVAAGLYGTTVHKKINQVTKTMIAPSAQNGWGVSKNMISPNSVANIKIKLPIMVYLSLFGKYNPFVKHSAQSLPDSARSTPLLRCQIL
jgi:hypothetical protein